MSKNRDNNVSSPFSLLNVLLHQAQVSVTKQENESDQQPKSSVSIGVRSTIKEGRIETHLKLQMEAFSQSMTEATPFPGYSLNYCTLGIFQIPDNATKDDIDLFARKIAFTLLIPYAREFSADIARRMGIPENYMPIFNPKLLVDSLIQSNSITVEHTGIAADDEAV